MVKGIYPWGLNKGFDLKLCVGSQAQHETPEENWRMHWLKHRKYNNKDEDNSLITLDVKNLDNFI